MQSQKVLNCIGSIGGGGLKRLKSGNGRRRKKNSAMAVGFKVDTNVETLCGMMEVLNTGGDTCDGNISLKGVLAEQKPRA